MPFSRESGRDEDRDKRKDEDETGNTTELSRHGMVGATSCNVLQLVCLFGVVVIVGILRRWYADDVME